MNKPLRVLHIEDSEDDTVLLARILRQGHYDPVLCRVDTPIAMDAALHGQVWDLVIADWNLPQFSALSALDRLKAAKMDIPFIIVSGSIGEETAVLAMKAGAHDYVMKNSLTRLVPAVERELREAETRCFRRRTEIALRETDQRLELAIEGANIGIWDLNLQTGAVLYDTRWAQMLGYAVEELEPNFHTWERLLHPHDMAYSVTAWDAHIQGRTPFYECEFRLHNKSGEWNWILSRGKVVERDSSGIPLRAIGMHLDITRHKQTEETLAARTKELMRSNADLEQFVFVSSHDLKEPLRMVSSYCRLLQRRYKGQLDASADEFIDYAVEGAGRMHALLEDLLTFARVGSQSKPFESTDCMTMLSTACVNLKIAIEESGAIVTHDVLPTVMGDGPQLVQLFQNLIGNAIKYRSTAPPSVHVGVERQEHGWQFVVRDNGIGFDPVFSDRIFVIFQRLHTRDEYPGTGMGLAICKKIVERHGGRIWAESKPGQGSAFYFSIPGEVDGYDRKSY